MDSMKRKIAMSMAVCLTAATVGACGSSVPFFGSNSNGGGGASTAGGGAPAFTPASYSGAAHGTRVRVNSGTGSTTGNETGHNEGAAVTGSTLTSTTGSFTTPSAVPPNFDTAVTFNGTSHFGDRQYTNAADRSLLVMSTRTGNSNLNYAHYGFGSRHYEPNTSTWDEIAGFHYGGDTPDSSMPTTGTATYTGNFIGRSYTEGGATLAVKDLFGDTTIQADFGAGTVNGTINNIQQHDGTTQTAATYGLGFDVNMRTSSGNQNKYNGNAHFIDGAGNQVAIATGSTAVSGSFHGNNAEETTGALQITQTAPPGGTEQVTIVGAYGAKQ